MTQLLSSPSPIGQNPNSQESMKSPYNLDTALFPDSLLPNPITPPLFHIQCLPNFFLSRCTQKMKMRIHQGTQTKINGLPKPVPIRSTSECGSTPLHWEVLFYHRDPSSLCFNVGKPYPSQSSPLLHLTNCELSFTTQLNHHFTCDVLPTSPLLYSHCTQYQDLCHHSGLPLQLPHPEE